MNDEVKEPEEETWTDLVARGRDFCWQGRQSSLVIRSRLLVEIFPAFQHPRKWKHRRDLITPNCSSCLDKFGNPSFSHQNIALCSTPPSDVPPSLFPPPLPFEDFPFLAALPFAPFSCNPCVTSLF
jgi:hypothetical protein